jgi:uncharacterized protein YkwD
VKKALYLISFFLFIGSWQSAAAEAGLLLPYKGPSQPGTRPVNPAIVLRQRLVTIRFELLPQTEGQELILQLFDDVEVRAICGRVESNASGGLVWFGHDPGPTGALATLAAAAQTMAGTVAMPGFIYHIRPFEGHVHVVREIRRPASAPETAPAEGAPSTVEREVAELVNLERESENLHPLVWDSALGAAARGHSADMAQQNYFSHTSLDGRLFHERITAAGYPYGTCGENIAAGYSTPQAVMSAWMTSAGHRGNILNPAYCDIGVGYASQSASDYRPYWTQDFGRLQGVDACAPAATEYTISAAAGPHGRIAPSGSVSVPSGADQTFQITPDPGYRILEVRADGVPVGAAAAYTFRSVSANHSIEAAFEAAGKQAMPWIPALLLGD